MANKYRTLKTALDENSEPDLGGRQRRLNELAAEGWLLVTTVSLNDGVFVDTFSKASE